MSHKLVVLIMGSVNHFDMIQGNMNIGNDNNREEIEYHQDYIHVSSYWLPIHPLILKWYITHESKLSLHSCKYNDKVIKLNIVRFHWDQLIAPKHDWRSCPKLTSWFYHILCMLVKIYFWYFYKKEMFTSWFYHIICLLVKNYFYVNMKIQPFYYKSYIIYNCTVLYSYVPLQQ